MVIGVSRRKETTCYAFNTSEAPLLRTYNQIEMGMPRKTIIQRCVQGERSRGRHAEDGWIA